MLKTDSYHVSGTKNMYIEFYQIKECRTSYLGYDDKEKLHSAIILLSIIPTDNNDNINNDTMKL